MSVIEILGGTTVEGRDEFGTQSNHFVVTGEDMQIMQLPLPQPCPFQKTHSQSTMRRCCGCGLLLRLDIPTQSNCFEFHQDWIGLGFKNCPDCGFRL